jgi:hypothetical protein
MRWPRERTQAEMPDEDDMSAGEAPPEGRLGEIEARIAKLAERFDQLEFVIVEQFEPGMTDGGELPAGNLRDRLDRIEAGLGLLRRDAPATWDEAMASEEAVLDAAALDARLDEIAARLADLAHIAAGPGDAADALAARLDALEQRLGTVADEAAARHDSLLSAVTAEAAAREAALEGIAAAAATRRQELKDILAAEIETRHASLLAAIGPAQEAGDTVDVDIEALRSDLRAALAEEMDARHAGLLAALNEQAAVARTSVAAEAAAREAEGKALAEAAEARHAALLQAVTEHAETARALVAAEAAAREAALAAMPEAEATREADLKAALVAEIDTRHDAILLALDRAMSRPAPAPDLTQQHRSFAGFATALQTTLNQFEVSVDSILERLDGMARRLEAVEARIPAPAAAPAADAAPAVSGIETSLGALSDGIGALVEVLGQRAAPSPVTEADPAMIDQLGAAVTAAIGEAARGSQSAMDETLRDLRLTVAEIAADSLRLRSA